MRFARLILIFGLAAAGGDSARSAEPRKGTLTAEQLKQQAVLIADFRKARAMPEKRLELIERAAELSPQTLKNVLAILEKEIGKPLAEYRQQFMNAAAQLASRRTNEENLAEIKELRGRVLALSKEENLTKEMIVEVGDPALKRLKEIILIDRKEILKQQPQLIKKREALKPLGKQWEKCAGRSLEKPVQGAAGEEPSPLPSFEQYLLKEEEIAAALAVPMDEATRAVLEGNGRIAAKLDPEEVRCTLDLNLTRNLLGLPPVQIDLMLADAARGHSADMEELKFFAHESPVAGKKTPGDRAALAGTSYSGENIAMGTVDGALANTMWWHSPGHHKNMLGDHKRVGLGRSGNYWTELFGP